MDTENITPIEVEWNRAWGNVGTVNGLELIKVDETGAIATNI